MEEITILKINQVIRPIMKANPCKYDIQDLAQIVVNRFNYSNDKFYIREVRFKIAASFNSGCNKHLHRLICCRKHSRGYEWERKLPFKEEVRNKLKVMQAIKEAENKVVEAEKKALVVQQQKVPSVVSQTTIDRCDIFRNELVEALEVVGSKEAYQQIDQIVSRKGKSVSLKEIEYLAKLALEGIRANGVNSLKDRLKFLEGK